MMITRDPKVKRLLMKIADCKDREETKTLTKDAVEMLGKIVMDLEDIGQWVTNRRRRNVSCSAHLDSAVGTVFAARRVTSRPNGSRNSSNADFALVPRRPFGLDLDTQCQLLVYVGGL